MDVLIITLLLFAGLWSSSPPSAIYLAQAFVMMVKILFNKFISRAVILPGLIASACLVVFKVVMVALYVNGDKAAFFSDNETTLELLGVFLNKHTVFNATTGRTLIPDVIVLIISVLGLFLPRLVLISRTSVFSLVTLILVLATGLTRCSVADMLYLIIGITWVICWSYKLSPAFFKIAAVFLSCFAYLRVLLSYLFFVLKGGISGELLIQLGLLEVRNSILMVNFCLMFVSFAFLLYLYKPKVSPESQANLDEMLLAESLELSGIRQQKDPGMEDEDAATRPDEMKEETNLVTIMRTVQDLFNSARVLMLISRLLLFVWIVHYRSFICLALMIWLYYSVLEIITSYVLKSLSFTILPLLIIMHMMCYIANIFHFGFDPYFGFIEFTQPIPELVLQNVIIISFLLTYRAYSKQTSVMRRQTSLTPAAMVVTFILQNSDKFTLSVVFVVGLSAINLLHTGLMIICIVFVTNTAFAKKRWTFLVIYTMSILYIKYVWVLLIPFTGVLDNNETVYRIIGLPYTVSQTKDLFGYIPQDYLVWLLLLSEIMQLSAYRAVRNRNTRQHQEQMEAVQQNSRFFKCLNYLYALIKTIHIWIVYVFILLVILVSDLNLINFARFIMLNTYLIVHLSSAEATLEAGYYRVKAFWFVIEYYSGIVLAARYVYQFSIYANLPDSPYMHMIGIDIFKTSELYEFMIGDCLILIATVLTSRAFSIKLEERTRVRQSTADDFERHSSISGTVVPLRSLVIFTSIYRYISEPYNKLLCLIVFCLTIYWRLAASMAVSIVIICLYYYNLSNLYTGHNRRKTQYLSGKAKWSMRFQCWLSLFYLIILSCSLEYACIFISETFFSSQEYHRALWYMAVLGFARADSLLLFKVYGYFLILLMLIAERHCLEHLKATRDIERSIEEPVAEYKYREAIRVIFEESICMVILLLAFFKLTFVSIIYVLSVIASKLLEDSIRSTKFLSNILIVSILVQYGLIYSNINDNNTPVTQTVPDEYAPVHLPWYETMPLSIDDITFLNLGSDFGQLSNIFLDMLILLFINIYFTYLGRRRKPLSMLIESDDEIQNNSRLEKVRDIIYSSAHYFILIMVLIFVVQSTGLLSITYLTFCLFCLAKINYSIKSDRSRIVFAKIIKYILIFLMIDFTTAVMFQMPFSWLHEDSSPNWQEVVGLRCLWSCGESSKPSNADEYYYRILYRIITYCLLWVLYRMLLGEDYIEYRKIQMMELRAKAASLSLQLSEKFNDDRIILNQTYENERKELEAKLQEIDKVVKGWERKARLTRISMYRPERVMIEDSGGSEEEEKSASSKSELEGNKSREQTETYLSRPSIEVYHKEEPANTPFKTKVLKWFVDKVNPVVYKEFLSKCVRQPRENTSLNAEPLPEYKMEKADYLFLLYYCMMSNTQSIAIFIMFINHFVYASLESIVFPLMALCYILLENPRPLPKVWKVILVYAEAIVLAKYILQLEIWIMLDKGDHLQNYRDTGKLGFNIAENTYSESIFAYIIWDIMVILSAIMHRHFLIMTGLDNYSEFQLESLHEGKLRRLFDNREIAGFERFSFETRYDANEITLWNKIKLFFIRLLPIYKEEKPGKDYYSYILWCQIIMLVFLFCFYTKMNGQDTNISSSFSMNQFSGEMAVAIVFHVTIMLFERYLYLSCTSSEVSRAQEGMIENRRQINCKPGIIARLLFYFLMLLFIHAMVFWYFPIVGNELLSGEKSCSKEYRNEDDKCNNFQINNSLQFFYIFYLIYFVVSALQLRHGLPSFRRGSMSLMHNYTSGSRMMYRVYRGLPFLFEIKTVMDWTFTPSGLDLFQWFKFEDIYSVLFIDKCTHVIRAQKEPGAPIKFTDKCLNGYCVLFIILFIILIPLIIFSSLNPIVDKNPVKGITVEFGISIDDKTYTQLFSSTHVASVDYVSDSEWDEQDFSTVRDLHSEDKDIMQLVTISTYPDQVWDVTPPAKHDLAFSLMESMTQINSHTVKLQMTYSFSREYPPTQKLVSDSTSESLDIEQQKRLYDLLVGQNTVPLQLNNFYSYVIRLPTAGSKLEPKTVDKNSNTYKYDLYLNIENGSAPFWLVSCETPKFTDGIRFYAISDLYSPITFNFSVMTFYFSVVYLAGRLLRTVTSGSASNIIMTDMPRPDQLISMCEAIYIARMTGDIMKEEKLYYELISILRSPEILKLITGKNRVMMKVD
mmetsp:Transcript_10701/g.20818  ORF Transcript_10701/g.20818 Transcript_10701/m.20818 type:complete len:2184 (+) Transcript_10701:50-6601(+)